MVYVLQLILFVSIVAFPLTSCSEEATTAETMTESEEIVDNTEVEPTLETIEETPKIVIDAFVREPLKIVTQGGKQFDFEVEVADTPGTLQQGLMFREKMDENHGMIFIFPVSQELSFWMKNTYIALDVIFMDEEGTILNIGKGVPLSEEGIPSKGLAKAALEINQGTAKKLGIQAGDKVIFSGLQ